MTGKDDAVFVLGVKSRVKENVLGMRGLSLLPAGEAPSATIAAFSMSKELFRNLKLSLGRRLFIVLRFDGEGAEVPSTLPKLGLGMGEKLTLLGVRLDVGGISITAESSLPNSEVLVGISRTRLCRP